MKRALELTNQHFESSSGRTPEYLAWHRTFKREFTKHLESMGCKDVQIGKPNHFDMSGFFTNSQSKIFYFRVSDLRCFKDNMLVRTATHYKDYTGGHNQYASLESVYDFERELKQIILT